MISMWILKEFWEKCVDFQRISTDFQLVFNMNFNGFSAEKAEDEILVETHLLTNKV